MHRKPILFITLTLFISVIITLALSAGVLAFLDERRIPPHVELLGRDLSGKPWSAAESLLTAYNVKEAELVFRHGKDVCSWPAGEGGLKADIPLTLKRMGKEGSPFHHLAIRGKEGTYNVCYRSDPKALSRVVHMVAVQFAQPPVDAKVYWDGEQLVRLREEAGFKVDEDLLLKILQERVLCGDLSPIEVPGQPLHPKVTLKELEPISDLIAVFVTTYDASQINRVQNMMQAAGKVNNTLLMPGETFSLNQVLGERTEANGYRKAPVFMNRRVAYDVGGGLCQVASTLYNAAVMAGLDVVERWPHSLPVTYVPLGQDAAIAGEKMDLKFANRTPSPVLITMKVAGGRVEAAIYGHKADSKRDIRLVTEKKEIEPQVQVKINRHLPPGQEKVIQKGSKGYRVKTYWVVTEEGREIEQQLVSDDYYRPVPWVIEVGPAAKGGK